MFCPSCRSEFRPGFTRCATCETDLVPDLEAVARRGPAVVTEVPIAPQRRVEYCGFFSLDEARQARDRLRSARIGADILVRDALESADDTGVREEYWLRVDAARYAEVPAILGYDAADSPSDVEPESADFACSACGGRVAAQESFCSKCGARFEEG